jgi:non-heme chloroperoxidase
LANTPRSARVLAPRESDTDMQSNDPASPRRPSRRKLMITGAGIAAGATLASAASAADQKPPATSAGNSAMQGAAATTMITVKDGTRIYCKDWGKGPPVIFSHGWPLTSDSFESQMQFLGEHGFRCIAHDRRGHGRSSQPWDGNDMDTYAEDLEQVLDKLGVNGAAMIGFSTGGGEVARYIGRHGTRRITKAVLISAIPPLMLKGPNNPNGIPIDVFDGFRASHLANRSQLYKDIGAGPFFGFNKPGAKASPGLVDWFWAQGMQAGAKNAYDCIRVFSETDTTEDLKKFDVPTLVIHGQEDQIVPIDVGGNRSSKLIRNVTYKVYAGAPHGLTDTHKDQLNNDLLAFLKT